MLRRCLQRLTLGNAAAVAGFTALSMVGWAGTALADGGGSPGVSGGPGGGSAAAGGNLYAATNALTGNAIRVYHRSADGRLTLVGDTPTGGAGSGVFEQSAKGAALLR